jgi:hypothetical protein
MFGAVASDPPPVIDDLLGSLTPSVVTPLLAVFAIFVISVVLTTLMLRQRDLA